MLVPIILGSESDREFAEKITKILDEWKIPYDIRVASAHKVPERVMDIVTDYNNDPEAICYITIAGRSNGLSGVCAANSVHPVIACPPFKDKDDMMVNVNSSLMMPSDTPVMTVVDPKNAAMAAIRVLANTDKDLLEKIKEHIKTIKSKF